MCRRRKRKEYLKERIRESAGLEKEKKGLFKRENKGVLARRRKTKDYSKESIRESAG